MIAQGTTLVPDTGGGINGGDPDCPCATQCLPPNLINPQTGQCEPPETYKLTLTPNSATIEPGQRYTFTATVTKQDGSAPSKDVPINLSLKVEAKSGGHDHGDSTRPRGSIDNTQCASDATCKTFTIPAGSTTATFNFNSTDASGTHTVTANCDKCTNGAQEAKVDVKVDGLSALAASTDYALVGAVAGKHTDNHYLTATAKKNLKRLIMEYNLAYPTGPVLNLNDASLIWGGKFDISGKWAGEHAEHRRGVVIDIRANQLASAIPQARFNKFERIAIKNGVFADLHCAYSGRYVCPACLLDTGTNRHYHVRLLGKKFAQ